MAQSILEQWKIGKVSGTGQDHKDSQSTSMHVNATYLPQKHQVPRNAIRVLRLLQRHFCCRWPQTRKNICDGFTTHKRALNIPANTEEWYRNDNLATVSQLPSKI